MPPLDDVSIAGNAIVTTIPGPADEPRVRRSRAAVTGLVLSGGGARGCYEAGIIKYIRNELPARTRNNARFEIICGTSVGAINTCFLAASSHQPEVQGRALAEVWERLRSAAPPP